MKVNVIINRSVENVWKFFLDITNWEHWYGAVLKEVIPEWKEGAIIVWGNNQRTKVEVFVPFKEIHFVSDVGRTIHRFTKTDTNIALVEIDFSPSSMISFTDGGAGFKQQMQDWLNNLKTYVEK